MPLTVADKWTNQQIKKKFKNRSCRSRAKKAMYGHTKSIPTPMIRGWIRGKACRQGKIIKDLNRSHIDLRKLQYETVNNYEYIVYGDGYDDYNEQWLDNIYDPWLNANNHKKPRKIKKKQINIKPTLKATSKPILKPPSMPIKPIPISKPTAPKMVSIESMQNIAPPPKPKKTLIPDIEHDKTEQEEKEYNLLGEKYIAAMSEIETYGIYSSIEGLAERSTYCSHKDDKADPMSDNFKKIMKEIRKQLPMNIYTSINGSMFIRFDENNPRFLQVLLTGIDDTPYENGLFLFDIYLCDDYPNKPLMIKHISNGATLCHANNGPGGFSPNLHQSSGKVCLSLLGTWSGPGWESGKSNVYQVISTIMFMIFGANHPYYMEPSYGGWEGTVIGRKEHERRVIDYDEEVMYHNARYTILETLKKPYIGFEHVIKTHFKLKGDWILKTIERWIKYQHYTQGFKDKMKPILEEIKQEFDKLKK